MGNTVLDVGKRVVKPLLHGGREVLRVSVLQPSPGCDTPVARHVRALCEALVAYATRELYPAAAAALECAVQEGRALDFVPQRYEITVGSTTKKRLLCVEIGVRHTQGEDTLFSHRLATYWTPDGAIQRMRKDARTR